ncbi:hypothetical protein MY5147_002668 [Beauveria neobassiana]|uniref:Tyrosine-protein phosphatase yvh1 n=1 Tax=Beauveria bassiana D1-5 TaxID=1245745 RepID=A0A0A2VV40_BEABA|nr:Tyrosine-protein phosphatase yvh1 [Beauveria bassiana D1-5]
MQSSAASAEVTRSLAEEVVPFARVAESSIGEKDASFSDTAPPTVDEMVPSGEGVVSPPASKTECVLPPASITEIRRQLFIGNQYSSHRHPTLTEHKITAIVSIMDARLLLWTCNTRPFVTEENHLFIRCADNSTMNVLPFMSQVCDFIEERISTDEDANMLVHCREGISRSATVVIAYLMRKYGLSADEALAEVKAKRKVKPNSNFMDQLRVWGAVGFQIWQDDDETVPKGEYQAYLDERAVRLKAKGLTGEEPIGIQNL